MLNRFKAAVGAVALMTSFAANAVPTTWTFDGTFGAIVDPEAGTAAAGVFTGDAFAFSVTFDPALVSVLAPCVTGIGGTGCGTLYSGGAISFTATTATGDCAAGCGPDGPYIDSRIAVFNDFDGSNDSIANPVDLLMFSVIEAGQVLWRFAIGTTDLTAFTGTAIPVALPGAFTNPGVLTICDAAPVPTPPPSGPLRLDAQRSGCALEGFSISATATIPKPVPEPSTLALLGLALVGVGLATRRRMR